MIRNINELKTKGFVASSYPRDVREKVMSAIRSWESFCSLPLSEKKYFSYEGEGSAGSGYEYKSGIDTNNDWKENFDITISGGKRLERIAKQPIAKDFIAQASSLVDAIYPLIVDFADKTERAFKVQDLRNEVVRGKETFFVRFIHYFGTRGFEADLASPHVDQSGFTLHLFESSPGFQFLSYDKCWTPAPISEKETIIIPGMQMQLRSSGTLRALCHRVVPTEESAKNGRYSVVCFVQLGNTPKYDRERHGRLQEKEAGFNYGMSISDFERLFKK